MSTPPINASKPGQGRNAVACLNGRPLTQRQREVLNAIALQCPHEGCTGACNTGYYEPVEGRELTVARRLDGADLIKLVNGRHLRWIAAHITAKGREALEGKS